MKISPMQRAIADQLQFHIPRALVQQALDVRGIKAQSDIRIYPIYPTGWIGVVGAQNIVYIFKSTKGELSIRTTECLGFRANGSIIY